MKKDNLKILVLIGVPASGKSTWAKEYVRNHSDYIRVSRDEFRLMLKNAQICENKIEDMITALVELTIGNALSKKLNVLVDNTNLKAKYINAIIDKFKYQADIDFRMFDISLSKAIERDNGRESKVGEGVIKKMYNDYKALIDTFDFQPRKMVKNRPVIGMSKNSSLEDAVIFDIDGTLAHMGDRSAYDWMSVYKDNVNDFVAEQVKLHKSIGRKILIVTGRDAVCRKVTEEWLEMYGIEYDEMYMRPKDDFRKDTIIKREIYDNEIKDNYNVICVYDDRLSVIKEWNRLGLFVFCCNQGLVDF